MTKWMVTGLLAAAGIVWGANGYAASAEKVSAPKEYMQWLDELKKDMSRRGISTEHWLKFMPRIIIILLPRWLKSIAIKMSLY